MSAELDLSESLPEDAGRATMIGRAWVPGDPGGPSPVLVTPDAVFDLSALAPTCAGLLERDDLHDQLAIARTAAALGTAGEVLANTPAGRRDASQPFFLAPVDLQAVKACGVTFTARPVTSESQ